MSKKQRRQQVRREKLVLMIVGLIIILAIIAMLRTLSRFGGSDKEVTTISDAMVTEVLEISELSTVEYTYNAVAQAFTEDKTDIRYYVAYEGVVKAGIDFSKVKIAVDNEAKKINITLPEVRITECNVNTGTLEYIFTDEKYDDPQVVPPEAYKLCQKDLKHRANEEKEMLTLGRENAVAAIEGLVKPWVQQVDKEYVVEVQ